jgi:ferredoxin
MAGLAIITEACIDVKDRACVDVCPVQCIYEFDPQQNVLFSEDEAGSGTIETTHAADPDAIAVFGDSILYVNLEECTSCTACYQPDVCPVGAIYSEEHLPDGSATSAKYNTDDPVRGTTTHFSCSTAATCSPTRFDSTRTHAPGGCSPPGSVARTRAAASPMKRARAAASSSTADRVRSQRVDHRGTEDEVVMRDVAKKTMARWPARPL